MSAPPRPSPVRRLLRIVERVLAGVGLLFIVYVLAFDLSVVASPSMSPTLQGTGSGPGQGDWVLAERASYWFR
ncbi:MAG: hypothetical protein AAB215_10005, partial [Planctomycetota bacterium]